MRNLTILSAALLTLVFAGCKPSGAPSASPDTGADAALPAATASAEQPATSVTGTAPATTSGATLTIDPAEMRACDKTPRIATLSWDASSVPDLQGVEIWMSNPNKQPKLFMRAKTVDQKQTGAWIIAGSSISLKNRADGVEIARTEVRSIPCE